MRDIWEDNIRSLVNQNCNQDRSKIEPWFNIALRHDCNNNKNFTDPYNLVYGHHMSDYKMFGELDRFKDEDFFNSHRKGTLTINEKQYKLDVFAFMETDANVKPLFDPTNHTNQLEIIQQSNLYYNEPINKDILVALSTCKEPGSTKRTILI